MSDQNVKLSGTISVVQSDLDRPAPGESVYDAAISISGWVHSPGREAAACKVRAYLDDICVAEMRVLSARADVCAKLNLSTAVPTGFRGLGHASSAAPHSRDATLRVTASWDDHEEIEIAKRVVRLVPAFLRERPYGAVVHPENETVLRRENIYGLGPPIEEPGREVLNLILEYLPERSSVVDVGCGAGAYGAALIAAGHRWLGLETNSGCCEILARRQLPFRQVDSGVGLLPCADREFDAAICIEVLEHVKEPAAFLREIARLIRGRALFSVPNIEVLPYFHGWGVVPWHLLEGDHENFFTRSSLANLLAGFFRHVEVFSYGEHPLRTRDGVPLHVHLFAVGDK
jgi:2-polyprenyl-3-methyl-5-hydroxy-6-metoxy-1,4-benzoquinol methylase